MATHDLLNEAFCSEEVARQHVASKVLRVMELASERTLTIVQLSERLNAFDLISRCEVQEALFRLQASRRVQEVRPYEYELCDGKHVVGTVSVEAGSGLATLLSLLHEQPVPLLSRRGAKNGDTVEGLLVQDGEGRTCAEVLRVLRMARRQLPGTIAMMRECAWFIPDEELYRDVLVPLYMLRGAQDGDPVVVEINERSQGLPTLRGKVVRLLGGGGRRDPRVHAARDLERHGFTLGFSPEVEAEARHIAVVYKQRMVADAIERRDLRGITTFTIDPADACEVDDALSIRPFRYGGWEIGVHIADVSHFVKPGSLIDAEAYRRGTSLYLPNRTIAMLPPQLVEQCSLRPHEDRLAFSVIFRFGRNGRLMGRTIERTVIRSQRMFSYDEVAYILDHYQGECYEELSVLHRFAEQLKSTRAANGALFFQGYPELKFDFDERDCPIRVAPRHRNPAMKLIEEFMLLANRAIAQAVGKGRSAAHHPACRPFVYRIHGLPNAARFAELIRVARNLGYPYSDTCSHNHRARQLNALLTAAVGRPEENLLLTLAIRSMARARYNPRQRPHYGLAVEYYTHFTSPLRRYADIMVHRLVEHYILRRGSPAQVDADALYDACFHVNHQQVRADEAQDEAIRRQSALYMADRLGETFEAVVFSFSERYMVVLLRETGIHGRVHYADMPDDSYFLSREHYTVVGAATGSTYRLGDLLQVRLLRVDLFVYQVCFAVSARLGTTSLAFSAKKPPATQLYLPFDEG